MSFKKNFSEMEEDVDKSFEDILKGIKERDDKILQIDKYSQQTATLSSKYFKDHVKKIDSNEKKITTNVDKLEKSNREKEVRIKELEKQNKDFSKKLMEIMKNQEKFKKDIHTLHVLTDSE